MRKRIISIITLWLSVCIAFSLVGCTNPAEQGQEGKNLITNDDKSNQEIISDSIGVGKISFVEYKNTAAAKSDAAASSALQIQYGKNGTDYRLIFLTAVKGNTDSITFTRKALLGETLDKTKQAETMYEGLKRGDSVYYWSGEQLTTSSLYKGQYYFAVYTIEFQTLDSAGEDITVECVVDGVTNTLSATASLNATLYNTLKFEGLPATPRNLYIGDEYDLSQIQATYLGNGITPEISVTGAENSVVGNKFIAAAGGSSTVNYSYADPDNSNVTKTESFTVNVGRKIFLTHRDETGANEPKLTWNEYTSDEQQILTYKAGNALNASFNITSSEYYYAEAEFTVDRLKDGTTEDYITNVWYGFGHFKTNDDFPIDGNRIYSAIKPFDRALQFANSTGSINSNSVVSLKVDEAMGVKFVNKYPDSPAIQDNGFVKVGALRYGNYIYSFFDGQFAGVYTLPEEYRDVPTQPALYVNNYGGDSDTTITNISYFSGESLALSKLNQLMSDNLMYEHEGDFTLEFDYKSVSAEKIRVAVYSKAQGINAARHIEFGADFGTKKFLMNFEGYSKDETNKLFGEDVVYTNIPDFTINETRGHNKFCESYFNDYNPGYVSWSEPPANEARQYDYANKPAHYKLTRKVVGEGAQLRNEYTMEVSFVNSAGVTQTFSRKLILANVPAEIAYDNEDVIVMVQFFGGKGELVI